MVIISLIEVDVADSDKSGILVANELVEAAIMVSTMPAQGGRKTKSIKLLGAKIDQFRKRCKVYGWRDSLTVLKRAFSILKETRMEEDRGFNELFSL